MAGLSRAMSPYILSRNVFVFSGQETAFQKAQVSVPWSLQSLPFTSAMVHLEQWTGHVQSEAFANPDRSRGFRRVGV